MKKVRSSDGTPIAYDRGGAGPPLVLIHGTGGAATRWKPIIPALAEHFSVFAVDRRGRGDSGDGDAYAIEREFEDVAAVLASIGEPAVVLGHSFGGICALEAALRSGDVRTLVLYEPPVPVPGASLIAEGIIDRLQALLDAGDREEVLFTFVRDVVRMPPHEIARFRASALWPARVAGAHTLPRELRALERYRIDAGRLRHLHTPTLLLLGGDSPPVFAAAIEALDDALPKGRVVVMPGQRHVAMDTAPDLFVQAVLVSLLGTETTPSKVPPESRFRPGLHGV